ncbi:glycosyltransferase family 4 protein [Nocardioides mangrovi]|uniref:Glycosyltransferase family 1 protein n=1 Tax=Nocardioides mangrovi TaxID=2874580 RepID=A0ABS7UAX1_9ACTN|nr:glycosyltransferase family 1 protein [Nocardioides mangrovi]MBZ5738124.1 glycosyltransferase family 1 protein [Nocardioides mangrovi]
MRVAIVTESFLPQVNGVANTVRHVVEELTTAGHETLVVAPGPGPAHHEGTPVVRVRSVGLPGYKEFPLGLPDTNLGRSLDRFGPDLVHLASPIALGYVGLRAARRLGLPTVAVYQTDVSGFARQYGLAADAAAQVLDRWVGRLHRRTDRTLVPSSASRDQLAALGVSDLHVWGRGINLDLFRPDRRDPVLHRQWTDEARVAVGYVGRLAHEKQVHRLSVLADMPGVQLVVIGDGPARGELERQLPGAVFTGLLRGEELGRAFASLDVFVHTGDAETFCQTVQEAQASGVPVVAPAVGGPVDLVEHGRTGLLYDPTDLGSLRGSVATLLGAPGLRRDLAARARSTVQGRSWAAVVGELTDVHYRAVLGRTRAAA